jgi:hypothetical protein
MIVDLQAEWHFLLNNNIIFLIKSNIITFIFTESNELVEKSKSTRAVHELTR